ncbi:shikimate dehydrogenase family protein [Dysgonomonas macrotermitis]|uniref:Shikimate dehydrogenase n=1 Tax=Dysgonomonas macrotermitis TaxID=1346286 RepID=A0A1M4SXE2_9BACT|nr:shikimate dehydrogenase [Dysgonomonas macrotermitis]SHE36809.1 shikimate dehydrogenase [Dysgonomonas macrotermitis]
MKTFGLIGFPLKHSFSYRFFGEKFKKEEIDAQYLNFEIANIGMLSDIVNEYSKLQGLNVTIPYKEQVIPLLDEMDTTAAAIGAVNVIKITRREGKVHLKGYNSDLIGFQRSISPLLDPAIHLKALILGTGGGSKAVEYGLKHLGLSTQYVSRTKRDGVLTYDELTKDVMDEYKVIVNASPVGTFPNVDECPNIPYEYIGKDHLLFDLVYNPPLTKFLDLGERRGAKIKNGAEMLELQAMAAWEIWNQ